MLLPFCFLSPCRDRDQLPVEAGLDHSGHTALHLPAGGVAMAGVHGEHPQEPVDAALVGDEVGLVAQQERGSGSGGWFGDRCDITQAQCLLDKSVP